MFFYSKNAFYICGIEIETITNIKNKTIMKTLVRTNEFGKVSKSFYSNEKSAQDAAGSFLRDCTVNRLEREKRKTEIIDFEFEKYGFSKMPLLANYKKLENGKILITGVFEGLQRKRYTVSYEIESL